jgi:hypothetical protein
MKASTQAWTLALILIASLATGFPLDRFAQALLLVLVPALGLAFILGARGLVERLAVATAITALIVGFWDWMVCLVQSGLRQAWELLKAELPHLWPVALLLLAVAAVSLALRLRALLPTSAPPKTTHWKRRPIRSPRPLPNLVAEQQGPDVEDDLNLFGGDDAPEA